MNFSSDITEYQKNSISSLPPASGILSLDDVIDKFQKNLPLRIVNKNTPFVLFRDMLLKGRDEGFTNAINAINENLNRAQLKEINPTQQILVCSGASGIGKTRFGEELFDHLRTKPSLLNEAWTEGFPIHFEYLRLDFSTNVMLSEDRNSSETILAMRIAYSFFIYLKYDQYFTTFQRQAEPYKYAFTISNVIDAIRRSLKLHDTQRLFLFVHIDSFHYVLDYHWKGRHTVDLPSEEPLFLEDYNKNKEGCYLLKEMIFNLGKFMPSDHDPRNFVQPFLSGRQRETLIEAIRPLDYALKFISCPMLSTSSRIEILHDLTLKCHRPITVWDDHLWIYYLLDNTSGLPSALYILFEYIFGLKGDNVESFFHEIKERHFTCSTIFKKVVDQIDNQYNITYFARSNPNIISVLIDRSISGALLKRKDPVSSEYPMFTSEDLERKACAFLEDDEDGIHVTIKIPLFFLHLYKQALHTLNKCGR